MIPARSASSNGTLPFLVPSTAIEVEDRGEMGEVVVQDAHPSHVLAYRVSVGFFDRLRHLVTLLLSRIDREDGQFMELDAVQEGGPGTDSNTLVKGAVDCNPGILGVHLLHDLVPMGELVAYDKKAKHLVRLSCHSGSRATFCLKDSLELLNGSEMKFLGFFGLTF